MLRIAQILNNKAHWIFETEEMPDFPPDPSGNPIMLVDITDNPKVEEGWIYEEESNLFRAPTPKDYPKEPQQEKLSPIELLGQQLSDLEIQQLEYNLKATQEREFLGQQLSDLEISMLERGM